MRSPYVQLLVQQKLASRQFFVAVQVRGLGLANVSRSKNVKPTNIWQRSKSMALFGFQFVITLIAASILQKVTARYSFGRWLLSSRLYRFLPPTDDELKEQSSQSSGRGSQGGSKAKRRSNRQDNENSVFLVPKQVDLQLNSAAVTSIDVLQLPYYVEYRWMIDFSCFAFVVYILSEIYVALFPVRASQEINLSIVWLIVVVGIVLKALATVTSLYFQGAADTGERSLCLCFGAVCFLLTMVLFVACDRLLDIDLLHAHHNFTEATQVFIKAQNLDLPTQERSPVLLYFLLSLMFGVLACFLTFPCIRYARMYYDSLNYAAERPLQRLVLHCSFFSPLLVLLMWVKPLAREKLVESDDPILTDDRFESLRIWLVVLSFVFRVATATPSLQSYLYMVHDNVRTLKKEGGRITNVELRRMVNQPLIYLCVAAIQYFSPAILVLSLACLLKTFGHYSWIAVTGYESVLESFYHSAPANASSAPTIPSQISSAFTPLSAVFNVVVNRALWSFFLFTTCCISFFLSVCGAIYASQFRVK